MLAAVFVAAHAALGIAMDALPTLATLHAIVVAGCGVLYAAVTPRIRRLAPVVAYIAGSEVLWRMNRAGVFHEIGKYAVIAILVIGTLRIASRQNRRVALCYFGLLVPSIVLTWSALPLDLARQEIASNLSGPFAIAVAVIFFSNIRLTPAQLQGTFVALIGPVAGVGMLSLISTRAAQDLEFGDVANLTTSGGFGPNQVAAVLGLASLFLFLVSLEKSLSLRLRIGTVLLAGVFATQAALTFSRGGVVLAFAGVISAMFVLARGSRHGRRNVIVIGGISALLAIYVVAPRLDAFTKGQISERYSSTKTSGRWELAQTEVAMFRDHPLIGVGPGMARHIREQLDLRRGASHTEYTRMISEHGFLGLISLGCLLVLAVRAVRQPRDPASRAFAIAMVMWFVLFLAIYGTRIVAPALVLGLAFAVGPPPVRRQPSILHGSR